ncbi:MAG: hypothetical protein AAGF33_07355 [Pseudomonadota bacterium]
MATDTGRIQQQPESDAILRVDVLNDHAACVADLQNVHEHAAPLEDLDGWRGQIDVLDRTFVASEHLQLCMRPDRSNSADILDQPRYSQKMTDEVDVVIENGAFSDHEAKAATFARKQAEPIYWGLV